MVQKFTISTRDRTKEIIDLNRNGLSVSEYIEQSLLNYWEMKRVRMVKK